MLLRAARDIKRGQEVTRAYTPWHFDQDSLRQNMQSYGIDLAACTLESSRILPKQVVQHDRWPVICRLIAKVQSDLSSKSVDLQRCERVILQVMNDPLKVLTLSHYLEFRLMLLLLDVHVRQNNF